MANIGYGIQLYVSDVFPAVNPINLVASITDYTPPSPTRDIIDATSSSSLNFAREFIAGLIDYGESGAGLVWDLGNTADVLLSAMLLERNPRVFKALFTQYTPNRFISFSGFLTGFEPSGPMAELMTATITMKVTGAPVKG
jgi:hypothetical protein